MCVSDCLIVYQLSKTNGVVAERNTREKGGGQLPLFKVLVIGKLSIIWAENCRPKM